MTAAGLLTSCTATLIGGAHFRETGAVLRGVAFVGGPAVEVTYMRSVATDRVFRASGCRSLSRGRDVERGHRWPWRSFVRVLKPRTGGWKRGGEVSAKAHGAQLAAAEGVAGGAQRLIGDIPHEPQQAPIETKGRCMRTSWAGQFPSQLSKR